jgi:GT2 family glycosyltransferase
MEGTHRMSSAPDVSIVTVNYNTVDELRQCIDAVNRYRGGLELEHWVIDNASTDGSVEIVRSEYPAVKLVASPDNLGCGRARNLVFPLCQGRYILNLDSDVILDEGVIEALVTYMDEHQEVGVAGCKLLNADGTHQRSAFHLPLLGPALARRMRRMLGGRREDFSVATGPVQVGYLKGAIGIYRTAGVKDVGLFDPEFKFYSEEVDYHLRFHQAGWKVVYLPSVAVTHLWGRGIAQNFAECQFYREFSGLWFTRKHWPLWGHWYARALTIGRGLYYGRFASNERLGRRFPGKNPELIREIYEDVLQVSLQLRPVYPEGTGRSYVNVEAASPAGSR